MRLEQHRSLWGAIEMGSGDAARAPYSILTEVIPVLAKQGYSGIEAPFKMLLFAGTDHVIQLLKQHKMRLTVMCFTDAIVCPGEGILWDGPYEGYTKPCTKEEEAEAQAELLEASGSGNLTLKQQKVVDLHVKVLQEQVTSAYNIFGDRRKDEENGLLSLCVAHSGSDTFTPAMGAAFFRSILFWEEENDFIVAHETHRHRFLYSPYLTRDFFLQYPDVKKKIKLTADLSHWVCVAEADPDDKPLDAVVKFIIPNVYHTHCRVGHNQGPQVADPRSPNATQYLEQHEAWWDLIWQSQKERGFEFTTLIAEHGPPPYQQVDPRTDKPLASTWHVNHWIHWRRATKFCELFGEGLTNPIGPATEPDKCKEAVLVPGY